MRNSKSKKVIHYDPQSDVFYIGIKRAKEEECIELAPGVNVELDEGGKVIGIEILNASKIFRPVSKSLKQGILQPVPLSR
ncbi:MAG: DUF2283 domain-containing protein [bacterium]|nr:DUF2283 domain-containing protein [bacterium]